jgi:cellulose synthase/poly-beta-1,6-N-acetylglucosamine synthase-like glycosyltransferase
MTIDIIVNIYNEENINSFLESLSGQSYSDFRLVIVDDGSTDNSLRMVESFCDRLTIEIIRLHHIGLRGARAIGVDAVTNPIFAVFDADEVVLPATVENMVRALEDPAVAAVSGIKKSKGNTWSARGQRLLSSVAFHALQSRDGEIDQLSGGCLACKTDAIKAIGGFPSHDRYAEDAEVAWRLHDAGWKTIADDSVIVLHHDPEGLTACIKWGWRMGLSAVYSRMAHKSKFLKLHLLIRFAPMLFFLVLPFYPTGALLGFVLLFGVFQWQLRRENATVGDRIFAWIVFVLKAIGWSTAFIWVAIEYIMKSAVNSGTSRVVD